MKNYTCKLALTFMLSLAFTASLAQVKVDDAWIAATVSVQKSSAAFMKLKSEQALTLVRASSPAAGLVEVHTMNMEGGVMQMRPLKNLVLPAKQLVELKRGGTHLMVMDLKQQLKAGQSIPLTLTFEVAENNGQKKNIEQQIIVPVRSLTDAMAQPAEAAHQH